MFVKLRFTHSTKAQEGPSQLCQPTLQRPFGLCRVVSFASLTLERPRRPQGCYATPTLKRAFGLFRVVKRALAYSLAPLGIRLKLPSNTLSSAQSVRRCAKLRFALGPRPGPLKGPVYGLLRSLAQDSAICRLLLLPCGQLAAAAFQCGAASCIGCFAANGQPASLSSDQTLVCEHKSNLGLASLNRYQRVCVRPSEAIGQQLPVFPIGRSIKPFGRSIISGNLLRTVHKCLKTACFRLFWPYFACFQPIFTHFSPKFTEKP